MDDCKQVSDDGRIVIDGLESTVRDFVKNNSSLVSMDHFSSRPAVEEALTKVKMPDFIKDKYLEYTRSWGVVLYDQKAVGYTLAGEVHNPFPQMITRANRFENPLDVFTGAVQKIEDNHLYFMLQSPSIEYSIFEVHLDKDFYKKHYKRPGIMNWLKRRK